MTTLEIILIGIIWVNYGLFTAYQHNDNKLDFEVNGFAIFIIVILSPFILFIRIFYGIFSNKIFK